MANDPSFEMSVAFVQTLYQALKDAWDGIVNAVNFVLDSVDFAGIGPAVKAGFDALAAPVTEALERIVFFCDHPGDPGGIRTVGEDWTNNVGAHTSAQAGLLAKELLDGDNRWSGQAAEHYGEAVLLQGRALGQVKVMTDALQSTLNEIASAISAFWVSFAVDLAGYVVVMAGCVITAATGVGTVGALGTALAATVTFLGLVATASNTRDSTLAEKEGKLVQQTRVGAPFTPGWPPVVSDDLSDASVLDADKTSDWTPR